MRAHTKLFLREHNNEACLNGRLREWEAPYGLCSVVEAGQTAVVHVSVQDGAVEIQVSVVVGAEPHLQAVLALRAGHGREQVLLVVTSCT